MLLLMSGFFLLQNIFSQTMSTYIQLEPQFSADHSFLGNYALKMYSFRDTGVKVHNDIIIFQRNFFVFFLTNINLYNAGIAV